MLKSTSQLMSDINEGKRRSKRRLSIALNLIKGNREPQAPALPTSLAPLRLGNDANKKWVLLPHGSFRMVWDLAMVRCRVFSSCFCCTPAAFPRSRPSVPLSACSWGC